MVGDVPNILTTGVFERKELERYARGESIFLCFFFSHKSLLLSINTMGRIKTNRYHYRIRELQGLFIKYFTMGTKNLIIFPFTINML